MMTIAHGTNILIRYLDFNEVTDRCLVLRRCLPILRPQDFSASGESINPSIKSHSKTQHFNNLRTDSWITRLGLLRNSARFIFPCEDPIIHQYPEGMLLEISQRSVHFGAEA